MKRLLLPQGHFPRSRVARRVFTLFVLCALVPLAALAYVSFSQLSDHLYDLAERRLRETAKAAAMTVFERLCVLELEVDGVTARARQGATGDLAFVDDLWRRRLLERFRGVVRVAADGRILAAIGEPRVGPPPASAGRAHLEAGKTLVTAVAARPGEGGTVFLVHRVDPDRPGDGTLWCSVRAGYLWGSDSRMAPATDLFAVDESGAVLANSLPTSPPLDALGALGADARRAGQIQWSDGLTTHLTGYWTLYMKPRFGTSWLLAHSRGRADVLAPLHRFRVLFGLTALLTFLVVLWLSLTQLRRSMVPLEQLHEATRRIASREFGARVRIDRPDEFGDLGASFNAMAESLEIHLRNLATLNRVGIALSTERDPERILRGILDAAKDVTHADGAALYLAGDHGRALTLSLLRIDSLGLERDDGEVVPLHLPDGGPNTGDVAVRAALGGRSVHVADLPASGAADTPGYRGFDARHGYRSRSVLAVPMKDQRGELVGVLELRNPPDPPTGTPASFSGAEQTLVESLASQAAVTLVQNRLAAAVQDSERRYREVVDNSPGPIWRHDLGGRLHFVNPAFGQALGYEPAELLGRNLADLLVPPARQPFRDHLAALQGAHARDVVLPFVARDGEERVWACRSLRHEEAGRDPYVVGHGQDVTERERIESRLRQTQKLQAIGTLASGVAHDFNNILTPIMAYAEMALDDVSPDSEVHRRIEQIAQAAERARDLVHHILTFSRQRDHGRVPTPLAPVVKEALKLIRASLPSTIRIEADVETATGAVLADPVQIHQVLMNLCTNAEHSMRTTGGVLRVRLETVAVDDRFAGVHPGLQPGPHVRLTVGDTGCGMPPAVAERAFEPFFTTKERGEGTGLGLATVHGIVTDHGGAIVLTSRPGEGTTFEVYFPETTAAPAAPAASRAALAPGHGERILFVDDEPEIARLGQALLGSLGYRVEIRTDGESALEAFGADPAHFDLLVTDQTMPGLTGGELAAAVHRLRPGFPVVLCTGFSHTMDEARAAAQGIDAFLQKPFTLQEIARAVDRVLASRRAAPPTGDGATRAGS